MIMSQPFESSIKPIPDNILKIVRKDIEERSPHEQAIRNKYLMSLKFFRMMAANFSSEAVRQMMKEGKLRLH